jgi:polynucleotide 5'-hydroxyl-kinase GRC3/NOL9
MPSWDFVTSLVRRRPYAVPWSVIQRVDMLGSEEVACEEVLRALDVSIVALVESAAETDRAVPLVRQAAPATSAGQLRYDPNAPPTSAQGTLCLGLGVVRAIDTANASFHLLTPLPATLFARVNVLQKGEIELPTVLMVDYAAEHDGPEGTICGVEYAQVPYLESTGYGNGVGSKKRRVRRNVMRKSQFR